MLRYCDRRELFVCSGHPQAKSSFRHQIDSCKFHDIKKHTIKAVRLFRRDVITFSDLRVTTLALYWKGLGYSNAQMPRFAVPVNDSFGLCRISAPRHL